MEMAPIINVEVSKLQDGIFAVAKDVVAMEEPLEIQVEYSSSTGRLVKNIAITMRTPGNDAELAAGFLFTEGVIPNGEAIGECLHPAGDGNRIRVVLKEGVVPELGQAARNFYASSSCGICGKASIENLRVLSPFYLIKNDWTLGAKLLASLPEVLRREQELFKQTGGIHAAGLFDMAGNLLYVREDIGRHNAVDKVIGAALFDGRLPLSQYVCVLSGRAGFELVQKAAMAGIGAVAAIGAPSSLAVELAIENHMMLIGFLRNHTMNVYSGKERISEDF